MRISLLFLAVRVFALESLAEKATDPTASLIQLQLQNFYNFSLYDSSSYSNTFLARPVIPVEPTLLIPTTQLIRATVPLETTPSPHVTALGDTTIFDLFIFGDAKKWGRMGVGPVLIMPTASKTETGQGKWQLGPAFAAVFLAVPTWQFGILLQNPMSIAGKKSRPSANALHIEPFIVKHFENGWYAVSDNLWTFDWKNDAAYIPISLGLGKVFKVQDQSLNATLEFFRTAYRRNTPLAPKWTLRFNLSFLFPD